MDREAKFEKSYIEKMLLDNFLKLMPSFYEMQSSFLSGIYKRYGDLEGGHIVIFFARDLHLQILRKREKDLDFNLSLDNFWNNHKNINQGKKKVIFISKETGLPKETTRRKLINLIKKKHIKKIEKNKIFWEPVSEFKETYIKIIEEQISSLSKFIYEQGKFLNLNLSYVKIQKEIKTNYSFFWYHYLNFQLEYIKFWQQRLKDLELLLIGLQAQIQTLNFLNRKTSVDFNSLFLNKLPKGINIKDANISATSISEITGIPRATCIRKLEKLVNLGIFVRETKTKRYYVNQVAASRTKNILTKDNVQQTVAIFSDFVAIVLNAMVRNRSFSSKYI